jgi:excisionase family DNA binding protein
MRPCQAASGEARKRKAASRPSSAPRYFFRSTFCLYESGQTQSDLERNRGRQPKILLSFKEVIEVTGLSRPTLYRQMRAGQLGFVKVGRRTLFRPADLQAFIESHIKAPAETANRTV